MTASHELSKVNPIIQVGTKKVIQHPTIGLAYCEKPECETKFCDLNNTQYNEITKIRFSKI